MNGLGAFFMIIVAAVLLALLGLALVRRTVPHDRLARHIDVAGYVYAVIGVIYAVILAQVVIAAWQEYQDARAVADDEANAVLNLARLAQVWSDEDRERVEDALSAYARHVVDVEWPDMAQNQFDESLHTAAHPRPLASSQRSRSAGGRSRSSLRRVTPAARCARRGTPQPGASWREIDCRKR